MKILKETRFFIPLEQIPSGTAQQRKFYYDKRKQKIETYQSDSYRKARQIFIRGLLPHRTSEPFMNAVLLDVEYLYETSDKKKIGTYKLTRPDADNLLKVFADQLMKVNLIAEDANICVEAISKKWVAKGQGGIKVHLAEIENNWREQ